MSWPSDRASLISLQEQLALETPEPWALPGESFSIGACFVCFERGATGAGRAGERGWAAAVTWRDGSLTDSAVVTGAASAPYEAGLLSRREGPLLAAAVGGLPTTPDVLLVDATGRDHPRRAGMTLHLGAVLGVPTVGITNRTLVASGETPSDEPGATAPLVLDGVVVGYWLRTRRHAHPVAVHAAWRTSPEVAVDVVLAARGRWRTPPPLREARRLARLARASRFDEIGAIPTTVI